MARRVIDAWWDRETRNDLNHNFKELYDKYIEAGESARDAQQKASEAVAEALFAREIAELRRYPRKGSEASEWEHGSISQASGNPVSPPNITRVRTAGLIPVMPDTFIELSNKETYKMAIYQYSKGKEYIGRRGLISEDFVTDKEAYYIKVVIAYNDEREIPMNEIDKISEVVKVIPPDVVEDKSISIQKLSEVVLKLVLNQPYRGSEASGWEHGTFIGHSGDPSYPQNPTRIRTMDYIAIRPGAVIKLLDKSAYKMGIYLYDEDRDFLGRRNLMPVDYTVEGAFFIKIAIAYNDEREIPLNEIDSIADLIEIAPPADKQKNKYYIVDDLVGVFENEDIELFESPVHVQSEEIFALYDDLMSDFPDYITKELRGTGTGNTQMYAYRFAPEPLESREFDVKIPKIIIVAGIHGDEKNPVFATYNMFRQICKNWREDDILEFLRFNIEFVVVPIANQTGFNRNRRYTDNDVDLSRNFPVLYSPTTGKPGAGPASEPETQLIMDLMDENRDAEYLIDYHNMYWRDGYMGYVISPYEDTSTLINKTINTLGRNWQKRYPFFPQEESHLFGYSVFTGNANLSTCTQMYGIKGATLEIIRQVEWQPEWSTYDAFAIGRATELLVNTLKGFIKQLY